VWAGRLGQIVARLSRILRTRGTHTGGAGLGRQREGNRPSVSLVMACHRGAYRTKRAPGDARLYAEGMTATPFLSHLLGRRNIDRR